MATAPPPLPDSQEPKKGFFRRIGRWLAIGFGGLILLSVCVSLIGGDGDTTDTTLAVAAETTITTQGGTTAETTTSVESSTTTVAPTTTTTTEAVTTTTFALPDGSFFDGIHIVGEDIEAGRYVSPGDCYWERLAGVTGSFDDIIANDNPRGQSVVDIAATDMAFSSNDCIVWVPISALEEAGVTPESEFGAGTMIIGMNIDPGIYESDSSDCYWQRSSGFSGDFNEILANDNVSGHAIVEIDEGDVGFTSSGCETWRPFDDTATPGTSFGDGVWAVGVHIQPGIYETEASGCYWERSSGFSGAFGEILANDNVDGQTIVEILPSDTGFTSSRCGEWTLRP